MKRQIKFAERMPERKAVLDAARAADRKLMFVPLLFVLCRVWGIVRFLLFALNVSPEVKPPLIHKILLTVQVSE